MQLIKQLMLHLTDLNMHASLDVTIAVRVVTAYFINEMGPANCTGNSDTCRCILKGNIWRISPDNHFTAAFGKVAEFYSTAGHRSVVHSH